MPGAENEFSSTSYFKTDNSEIILLFPREGEEGRKWVFVWVMCWVSDVKWMRNVASVARVHYSRDGKVKRHTCRLEDDESLASGSEWTRSVGWRGCGRGDEEDLMKD